LFSKTKKYCEKNCSEWFFLNVALPKRATIHLCREFKYCLRRSNNTIAVDWQYEDTDGVARLNVARGWQQKCRPFHPSNLLIRIQNERSCFVLCKDIGGLKCREHQNQTLTNWNGSYFSFSVMGLGVSACSPLFSLFALHVFFCLIYRCAYELSIFRYIFFPVGLQCAVSWVANFFWLQ